MRLLEAGPVLCALLSTAVVACSGGNAASHLAAAPAFDPKGNLWVAANERNAVVEVTPEGKVRDVAKNDSRGPLEFPTSVVFVGSTAYVSNFDTPRRDNLAADGKTSLDGVGASIAQITP